MRLSCYLVRRVILCAFFFSALFIRAQTAVTVGAGSYATSIPPIDQYLGGYYSMTAQQVNSFFDKFITNNKDNVRTSDPLGILLLEALQEAYPCPR